MRASVTRSNGKGFTQTGHAYQARSPAHEGQARIRHIWRFQTLVRGNDVVNLHEDKEEDAQNPRESDSDIWRAKAGSKQ